MDRLDLLSVALGLSCLAGINLYLTVFATGLAIHQHWITLSPAYESLAVLGDPLILTISGVLFGLQFFADKIPWLDSIWDAVHTVIRPLGAILLALQVIGHPSPIFSVIVALLAGTTALAAHTAKASTRLISNTSPEPFTNIGLSFGEDAAVIGGLALIYHHPMAALAVFAALLAAFAYLAPRLLRSARVKLWLIWRKLSEPPFAKREVALPLELPLKLAAVFDRENILGETIAWAVQCAAASGRRIPSNIFGALVATNEEPNRLTFVARKGRRGIARTIELQGATIDREPKFLSENLLISPAGRGRKYRFLFPRPAAAQVERIVETLRASRREPADEPALTGSP